MEVDSSDVNSDSSRGLDDSEEPTTPEDKIFFMDSPFMDREKDEEPVKTIRYMLWTINILWRLELKHKGIVYPKLKIL